MPIAYVVTDDTPHAGQPLGHSAGDSVVYDLVVGPQAPRQIDSTSTDLDTLYRYPEFTTHEHARGHWVRAGMIMSITGSAAGSDGLSGSLACRGDREIFETLRRQADVIVVGAKTAREEDYGPSKTPLAIMTASGELPPRLRQDSNTLLICPTESAAAQSATHASRQQVVGLDSVSPAAVCAALSGRGFHKILLEGGPGVLSTWLAAGCVHELCLTLSPQLTGPVSPLVAANNFCHGAELAHMLHHGSALFTRWTLPDLVSVSAASSTRKENP